MDADTPPSVPTIRRWVELYREVYDASEAMLASLVVAPDGYRDAMTGLMGEFRRDLLVADVEADAMVEPSWQVVEAFRGRWLPSAWAVVARIDAPGSPFLEVPGDTGAIRERLMYLTEQVALAMRLHPESDWDDVGWPDLPVVSLPPMPDLAPIGEALAPVAMLGALLVALYYLNNSPRKD